MFEVKLALRYLIPRKKSLSTSLVSLLSVGVISLVVWLVIVFLSITSGIERSWLQKLTALHGPVRITPTEEYYTSWYYRSDALSGSANYTVKTLGEKALSHFAYDEEADQEAPGEIDSRDLVKETLSLLEESHIPFQDYELGGALLKLTVQRNGNPSTLSQMSYLLSILDKNPGLGSLLLPPLPGEESLPQASLAENGRIVLPDVAPAEPILLPKAYRDTGVHLGDRGSLSFAAYGPIAAQEQRIPIRVAGFYDPGFLPVGGRCLIVPAKVTRLIHAASQTFSPDGTPANGIFLWPDSLDDSDALKNSLEKRLKDANLLPFWNVSTYKDFEFAKDLLQQFRSDKTLFLLISVLILFVASCNIISLLILLVNDKKREIAILRAMGASRLNIACLFGFSGLAVGLLSSAIGILLAGLTLRHLDKIVGLLSAVQGHVPFHAGIFQHAALSQPSSDALLFILIATPLLSLTAALLPALRAIRISISLTLRQE